MYEHRKKAGNQGDVIKHVALVAALDTLYSGGSSPFVYADTFAGNAVNLLTKTGEWRYGIGRLEFQPDVALNPLVALWQRFWATELPLVGSTYPGSSSFAFRLAQYHGRPLEMHLWDIAAGPVAQLMTAYRDLPVVIHACPATPDGIPKCDFLLVDPPGVGPKRNYPLLQELLDLDRNAESYLLWLPMVADLRTKNPAETTDSVSWREAAKEAGYHTSSVRWTRGGPVCGCQLFYRLPPGAVESLRAAIDSVVSSTSWQVRDVRHADPL